MSESITKLRSVPTAKPQRRVVAKPPYWPSQLYNPSRARPDPNTPAQIPTSPGIKRGGTNRGAILLGLEIRPREAFGGRNVTSDVTTRGIARETPMTTRMGITIPVLMSHVMHPATAIRYADNAPPPDRGLLGNFSNMRPMNKARVPATMPVATPKNMANFSPNFQGSCIRKCKVTALPLRTPLMTCPASGTLRAAAPLSPGMGLTLLSPGNHLRMLPHSTSTRAGRKYSAAALTAERINRIVKHSLDMLSIFCSLIMIE
mmetsp:Transcript_90989/g.171543  ORF Transcript_90989/g.171543 Transcript_90989/m.171543 type:complete len:260 (-) Transcript_90989:952-1731(-)